MNKLERFIYARDVLCWTANQQGDVFNKMGRKIGRKHNHGYIRHTIKKDKKSYDFLSHQFIYFYFTNEVVDFLDHIDGNKKNNSISNLRATTIKKNNINNLHFAKGYTWRKKINKFQSQIRIDGVNHYLGLFDDEKSAREAYLKAKEKYHIY